MKGAARPPHGAKTSKGRLDNSPLTLGGSWVKQKAEKGEKNETQ